MGSRLKEDERNEKIIRGLLKQTSNRRCINCNSLGPQYVCVNFWTFVCTTCSGIHREFTHRVKSVSMSKFSAQEVSALQSGGNERAREIYFKDLDPQRQSLPDSSNVDRLREFIKNVYVDNRFSGDRPLPRSRGGDREETFESRRSEPRIDNRADSRSHNEDKYEDRRSGSRHSDVGFDDRRYDDRAGRYDERRSPGLDQNRYDKSYKDGLDQNRYDKSYKDTRRYEDRGRYDNRDRHHDDQYNEGLDRRFEDRSVNGRRRLESVHHRQGYSGGSPPPVRPVKEILGDDVPPLRVEDHTNGRREITMLQRSQKDAGGQRFGSSSSFGSVDGNASALKRENSGSLIDFSVEPEAPAAGVQSDPFGLSVAEPTSNGSNSSGWATFNMLSTAAAAASAPASGGFNAHSVQMNGGGQWPSQWAHLQAVPASTSPAPPLPHESAPDGWSLLAGPNPQPPNAVTASQAQSPFSTLTTPAGPKPHTSSQLQTGNPGRELQNAAASITGAQLTSNINKQRQEIPEDVFNPLYQDRNSPNMGFHLSPQLSGVPPYGPQFTALERGQIATYAQPPKSSNPFDLPGDTPSASTTGDFPSLSPLQSALPNLNMGPMPLPGPGVRALGPQWSQLSLAAPQPAPYPSAGPAGMAFFLGQQMSNVPPSTMQPGLPLGVRIPGGYLNAPQSVPVSFFPGQGSAVLPSQNSVQAAAADSLFPPQGGPWLPSETSLGQFGGNTVVPDSLFPLQVSSQHPSQSFLGPPGNNTLGADTLFLAKGAAQLPSQSSLGPSGNPFS